MKEKTTAQDDRHGSERGRVGSTYQNAAYAALRATGAVWRGMGNVGVALDTRLPQATPGRRVQQQQVRQAMPEIEEWLSANPLFVWRTKARHSQATIAQLMGVSVNTVRSWERGLGEPTQYNKDLLRGISHSSVTSESWAKWYESRPQKTVA